MLTKPYRVAAAVLTLLAAFFFWLPEPKDPVDPSMPGGATADFAIRNVRVFDGADVLAGQTVVVRDGRIEAVGVDLAVARDLLVVDGSDRTLLPGFIDAHTHSYGTALADALRFGVTTTLDMFSTPTVMRDHLQQRKSLARTANADLYSAGFLATSPMGHGTQFGITVPAVDNIASIPGWVDARIAEGSDYIKIAYEPGIPWVMSSLDLPSVRALVQAAQGRGKLAVAHISRLRPAQEALDAGVDGLVHTFADRVADDEFIARLERRSAFVVPTLSIIAGIEGPVEAKRFAADERIANRLSAAQRSTLIGDWAPRISHYKLAVALDSVRRMHAAGVDVLAGTDAPNPGTAHGASMHHELALLVRAGLSPKAALAAATSRPAQRFRLADRGRIAAGLRADLVLVRGDPTQDIEATRNIERIWKNGYAIALDVNGGLVR